MSRPLCELYPRAFITGASTGLGAAFADMLLAEGVEVWGTSRSRERLAPREGFHPVVLDLADGAEAERVFLAAAAEAGGFALVINNAGFGAFGDFVETDFSVWERQMHVMLINTARLSRLALRGMRELNRGALVNVSSLAAEFPLPYQSTYNVVKAGLSALTESLMIENVHPGLAIIDFRPGDYRTEFEGSVVRPVEITDPRQQRAWRAFGALMNSGPAPAHAAATLARALRRGRSGTVRTGRFFQATLAPFLARFSPLALRRRIIARYFDLP